MITGSDIGGLLLAEICALCAGFGLATWLVPQRSTSRVELIGLTLILGSGMISLLLFGLAWVLAGTALVTTIVAASLALGIAGILRLRRLELTTLAGSRTLLLLLILIVAAVAWQAVHHPLYADGLFNFEVRAQIAVAHGGLIPAAFYSDAARVWMHPEYPLFLPLNQAWVYLCLGRAHQSLVMLLSAHFVAAGVCLLYAGMVRLTQEPWRASLAVVLMLLLPSATVAPGGAASLWADFPLAVAFLATAIYLIEFTATGRALGCLAAFLALLPWIKREGVVLAGIAIVVAGYIAWKRGNLRQLLPALLPAMAMVVGWKVFLAAVQASPGRDFQAVTPENFFGHLDRIPFILTVTIRELLAWDRWCVLWPMAFAAAIVIARHASLHKWRALVPLIAVPLAIYSFVYIFSAWDSLPLHVVTSLPRLLLPLSMPAILAIAVATPMLTRGGRGNGDTHSRNRIHGADGIVR